MNQHLGQPEEDNGGRDRKGMTGSNQGLEAQENRAQGGQDGESKVVRPV